MTKMYEAGNHLLICAEYSDPALHRHNAAHILISLDDKIDIMVSSEKKPCRGIIIPPGVVHTANTHRNIYASKHHNNTSKLVKAISDKYEIATIDATKETLADLTEYDTIAFASGIEFGKFYEEIENFAEKNLPTKKEVFFLYTCAMKRKGFTNSIKEISLKKDAFILGEYGCKGYNTYGPWKLIGGTNKNHPTEVELMEAVNYFGELLKVT